MRDMNGAADAPEEKTTVASICGKWWNALADDRVTRNRLRRADTAAEAILIPRVHTLAHALAGAGHDMRGRPDRLAAMAIAMANLDHHADYTLASACGRHGVRQQRFDAMTRNDDVMDLARIIARVLPIIGRRANPGFLASDIFYWGDQTRIRWSFDFFSALDN